VAAADGGALASRGFVYTSARTAGDHNQYHSHCSCVPVASWESSPLLEGYDPDGLYQQYLDGKYAGLFILTWEERGRPRNNVPGLHPDIYNPAGNKIEVHEIVTANRLHKLGFQVDFIPKVNLPGVTTLDIWLNGAARWEIKAPLGAAKTTIENQLDRAKLQSDKAILDTFRTPLSDDHVLNDVRRYMAGAHRHITHGMVLLEDGSMVVIPRTDLR